MQPANFQALFDLNLVPIQLVDCIMDLLRYEPKARLTTQQCLEHPYFREVAVRLQPIPLPPAPTYPPTPSSGSYSYPQQPLPTQTVTLVSPPQSGHMVLDSPPAGRALPPSHSHGPHHSHGSHPVAFRASEERNGGGSLPSPQSNSSHERHFSLADSVASVPESISSFGGMSILHPSQGRPLPNLQRGSSIFDGSSGPSSNAGYPESVLGSQEGIAGGAASPAMYPSYVPVNGSAADYSAQQQRAAAAHAHRSSAAASTFYDGSIFEGIAPTRASSIMSFPVHFSGDAPAPQFSQAYNHPYHARAYRGPYENELSSPPGMQSPSQSTQGGKGRSWTLASVFDSTKQQQPGAASTSSQPSPPLAANMSGSSSLKRTPSESSQNQSRKDVEELDPKKAKKAAKEAEKAKREAATLAARDRARAVMLKKSRLGMAGDFLNNYTGPARTSQGNDGVGGGKDKGKGRAGVPPVAGGGVSGGGWHQYPGGYGGSGSPLPQIAEDSTRLRADSRHKARRRDDDDDVHSIAQSHSSVETTRTSSDGRRISMSSYNTMDSDPGPPRPPRFYNAIQRATSVSSLDAASRLSVASQPLPGQYGTRDGNLQPTRPPGTSASSVDSQLVQNFGGLWAAEGGGGGGENPNNLPPSSEGNNILPSGGIQRQTG
jgi:hypothetical protein